MSALRVKLEPISLALHKDWEQNGTASQALKVQKYTFQDF